MALIKCPECGKEYSGFAQACPQCGFPTELLTKSKMQCEFLHNFKITKGILVKYIGDDEVVHIPNTVTKIGNFAFYKIKTAKQIIIPSSVLEICGKAFFGCNAEIVWDNPHVFSFHKNAFAFYEGEKLFIPPSVTFIGRDAIWESLIKEITMSPNVVDYGSGDDYGHTISSCKNLQRIIIPEGLKRLPKSFISGDSGVRLSKPIFGCSKKNLEINIPNSIEIIDEGMISISSDFLKLNHFNGGAYLGNDSNPFLVFVIPDGTSDEVVVHKNCKFISPPAYAGFPKLKKFVFGNQKTDASFPFLISSTEQIETTGNDEFITIDGVLYTKELDLIEYPKYRLNKKFFIPFGVKKASFCDCEFLEEIELSDTVEHIGIHKCNNLINIIFNNSVKNISINYLPKITYLKDIPKSLEEFHLKSEVIKSLYFPNGIKRLIGEISCYRLEQVRLPDDLEEIGENFLIHNPLKELSLPSSLKVIRRLGLPESLESLSLPLGLEKVEYPIGPTKVTPFTIYGNCLYFGTQKNPYLYLVKAESNGYDNYLIHESCNYIEKEAFFECSKLKNITIPEGVVYIGEQAFARTSLEKIDIPSSVKEIGKEAFGWCTSLKSVILHEGIEELGIACFCDTIIEELVIPNSVSRIENYAFEKCMNLSKIILSPNIDYISWCAFPETNLYMNISNNGCYIGTSDNPYYYFYKPVSKEEDISFEVVEGCECIMEFAFNRDKKIKSIKLPKTIKRIDNLAFDCLFELEEIIFNASSESWGKVRKRYGNDILDNISIVTNDSGCGIQKHPKCRVIGVRFEEQEKGCYYYLCHKTYKLGEHIWVDVNGESKRTKIVFIKDYQEDEPLPYDYFSMKFVREYPSYLEQSNPYIYYGLTPQEFAKATKGVRSKYISDAVCEYIAMKELDKELDNDITSIYIDDSDYISSNDNNSYDNDPYDNDSYDNDPYYYPDDDD